jgi:tetratricopeptide (TPR) repeat protein
MREIFMGAHYGSVQVRSEDREKVKAAAQEVSAAMQVNMLVAPVLDGWIGIYPENNGQDQVVGEKLATLIDGYLLQMLVHDDSVFAYWLYHNGKLMDSHWSSPGYFGEENREAEEKMVGNHELFRPLIGESIKYLPSILDRKKPQPTFLSDKLADFAKVLRIPNALRAYEYIQQKEGLPVEGWPQFEEIHAKQLDRKATHIEQIAVLSGSDADSYALLFLSARAKSGNGDAQGALADLTQAININPNLWFAYSERGLTKYQSDDLAGALSDFDKTIELHPDGAAIHAIRGNAKRRMGNIDGSLADYNRAIELDATVPSTFNNRGVVKMKKGDLSGALFDFNRAIELAPNSAIYYKNRGDVKRATRDYGEALANYTKSIELRPEYVITYHSRALIKSAMGDLGGALADYDKAIQLEPKPGDLVNILKNRERLLDKKKSLDSV